MFRVRSLHETLQAHFQASGDDLGAEGRLSALR